MPIGALGGFCSCLTEGEASRDARGDV